MSSDPNAWSLVRPAPARHLAETLTIRDAAKDQIGQASAVMQAAYQEYNRTQRFERDAFHRTEPVLTHRRAVTRRVRNNSAQCCGCWRAGRPNRAPRRLRGIQR